MGYGTAREFVNDLMKNEKVIFEDGYGRQWMYDSFVFYFSDLGELDFTPNKISCLHLYGTGILPKDNRSE